MVPGQRPLTATAGPAAEPGDPSGLASAVRAVDHLLSGLAEEAGEAEAEAEVDDHAEDAPAKGPAPVSVALSILTPPMNTPTGEAIVITPPAAARRRHDLNMVIVFVIAALPVGAVVFAIIGPWLALAYVVGQTAFLTYGLRRRHVPTLRLDAVGLSYEPGRFQLRCRWDDIDGVGETTLPSGPVAAFTLRHSALHWAAEAKVRAEVREHGWDHAIPIGEFEPEWQTGQIGEAARRWAPHLLGS